MSVSQAVFESFLDQVKRGFLDKRQLQNEISNSDCDNEQLRALYLAAVQQSAESLGLVPLEFRTFEICAAAMEKSEYSAMKYLPDELLDHEQFKPSIEKFSNMLDSYPGGIDLLPPRKRPLKVCIEVVKQNSHMLKHVPDEFLSNEAFQEPIAECLAEIGKNGRMISNAPVGILTQSICDAAIDNTTDALYYIPKQFHNQALYDRLSDIKYKKSWYEILDFLKGYKNKTLLTKEQYQSFCLAVIRENPYRIESIIPNILDLSFCKKIAEEIPALRLLRFIDDYTQSTALNADEYNALALALAAKNIDALQDVKSNSIKYETCLALAQHNGLAVSEIYRIATNDVCENTGQLKSLFLAAVKQNGLALEKIELDKRDVELCAAATAQHYRAIAAVPKDVLNDPHFQHGFNAVVLSQIDKDWSVIANIPRVFRNFDNCMAAVVKYQYFILNICDYAESTMLNSEQYQKICLAAVTKDGSVLSYVNEEMRSMEICIAAVQNNWEAIEAVPAAYLSNSVFASALEKCRADIIENKKTLNKLPASQRDLEICKIAVSNRWYNINSVPNELLDADIFKDAITKCHEKIKSDPSYIEFFPEKLRTLSMCVDAVNMDWRALAFVPEKFLDDPSFKAAIDKYHAAIKQDWKVLKALPESISGFKDWKINNNPSGKLLTEIVCIEAIKQAGKDAYQVINHLPPQMITNHFCHEFLKLTDVLTINFTFPMSVLLEAINNYKQKSVLTREEYKSFCFAVILKMPHLFKEINKEIIDFEFCMRSAKELTNPVWLSAIADYENHTVLLGEDEYRKIVFAVIEKNGLALAQVPGNQQTYEMCLASVRQNGLALQGVKMYDLTLPLSAEMVKQYKTLCKIAVAQNVEALQFVPDSLGEYELYFDAVKRNANAARFTPVQMRDFNFCKAAVENDGSALFYFINYQETTRLTQAEYEAVCLAGVKNNGNAIDQVPVEFRRFEICYASVSENGMALEEIQKDRMPGLLTEEEYKKILIKAVQNNSNALQFVDEKYKAFVIDAISPEKILFESYQAKQYFPATPDYSKEITTFLSKIRNIVITYNDSNSDREIRDSFFVYADSPKRKGKTIKGTKDNVDVLLSDLQKLNNNTNPRINLAFLGHASASSESLAGVNVEQMLEKLKKFPCIERLTLLGCNTAKSSKLEYENEIIKKYQNEFNSPDHTCGLVLAPRMPTPDECMTMLDKTSNENNPNRAKKLYILFKETINDIEQYRLILIRKGQNNTIETIDDQTIRDQAKKDSLGRVFGNANGKIPFPGKKALPLYYRGNKNSLALNVGELQRVNEILHDEVSLFDKSHPLYKGSKASYPFLKGFKVDLTEVSKIMPSLLQRVISAIQRDASIKRDVVVKGYTKPLHVNTKTRGMVAAHAHLYKGYDGKSGARFFDERLANLDPDKLSGAFNKEAGEMAKGSREGETHAKSLKVHITKRS